MKKVISIALAFALVLCLSVVTFAKVNLDSINEVGPPGEAVAAQDTWTIGKGGSVSILGWAYEPEGTPLQKIYYTVDGTAGECSDKYRDRGDVAEVFKDDGVPEGGRHAGFGYDGAGNGLYLLGIENLDVGTYEIEIIAVYEDGNEEVGKTFTLEVVDNGDAPVVGQPTVKVIVGNDTVLASPNATAGCKCETVDGKLVVTTDDGAGVPWVSIPLDKVDTTVYKTIVVKYSVDPSIHGNNVYLCDTEVNPGYSGTGGTWTPPQMDGNTERTFVIAEEFPTMDGTKLTSIRFPGAVPGGKLVIESISFIAEEGTEPGTEPATQPETVPATGDAAVATFAVIAVLAMGAAVVFMKKKTF